jgi:hypothetical protein
MSISRRTTETETAQPDSVLQEAVSCYEDALVELNFGPVCKYAPPSTWNDEPVHLFCELETAPVENGIHAPAENGDVDAMDCDVQPTVVYEVDTDDNEGEEDEEEEMLLTNGHVQDDDDDDDVFLL